MTDSTSSAFYASLMRARVAAGALITDEGGGVLIVEPSYKDHWEIPGGIVEQGETPLDACVRELREELGLDVAVGRLLVIEYRTEPGPRGDSAMLVYDGGVLRDPDRVRLSIDELKSFAFVREEELGGRLTERLARRLTHALEARKSGTVVEINNGARR